MKNTILIASFFIGIASTMAVNAADVSQVGEASQSGEVSRFGIGGKLNFSTWEGDHDGGPQFESDESQFSISLHYQRNKFYSAVNIQGGQFSFHDNAPARNTKTAQLTTDNVVIERGELDLIAGYYFWPRVSLFLDLKGINNTWRDLSYSMQMGGLGLGIAGFAPLNRLWTLYISCGVVPLDIESSGTRIGDGTGGSLELGLNYKVDIHQALTIGLKAQHQTLDFDNGSKQTHDIGSLALGYNYTFD